MTYIHPRVDEIFKHQMCQAHNGAQGKVSGSPSKSVEDSSSLSVQSFPALRPVVVEIFHSGRLLIKSTACMELYFIAKEAHLGLNLTHDTTIFKSSPTFYLQTALFKHKNVFCSTSKHGNMQQVCTVLPSHHHTKQGSFLIIEPFIR